MEPSRHALMALCSVPRVARLSQRSTPKAEWHQHERERKRERERERERERDIAARETVNKFQEMTPTTSEEYFLELPANFNIMLPKSSPLQPNNATGIQFTLLPGQTAKATDYLDARPLWLHGFAFWTTKFRNPPHGQLRVPFFSSASDGPYCGSEIMGMHRSHALTRFSTGSLVAQLDVIRNVLMEICKCSNLSPSNLDQATWYQKENSFLETIAFPTETRWQPFSGSCAVSKRNDWDEYLGRNQERQRFLHKRFISELSSTDWPHWKTMVKATKHASQFHQTRSSTKMKTAQTLGGSGVSQKNCRNAIHHREHGNKRWIDFEPGKNEKKRAKSKNNDNGAACKVQLIIRWTDSKVVRNFFKKMVFHRITFHQLNGNQDQNLSSILSMNTPWKYKSESLFPRHSLRQAGDLNTLSTPNSLFLPRLEINQLVF